MIRSRTSRQTCQIKWQSSLSKPWCKQPDRLKITSATRLYLWWTPNWQMRQIKQYLNLQSVWLCPNWNCARRIWKSSLHKSTDHKTSMMSTAHTDLTGIWAWSLKRHLTRRTELAVSWPIEAARLAHTTALAWWAATTIKNWLRTPTIWSARFSGSTFTKSCYFQQSIMWAVPLVGAS